MEEGQNNGRFRVDKRKGEGRGLEGSDENKVDIEKGMVNLKNRKCEKRANGGK